MNKTFTPAFPSRRGATAEEISALGLYKGADLVFDGMTLRDYFAAKALAAMIGKDGKDGEKCGAGGVGNLTAFAYEYADAMLEARK